MSGPYCVHCTSDDWVAPWPCGDVQAADRAEQRLKELTDE